MPTILVDQKPYTVADGRNLLDACLSLGFDLPYFCWHPALGSVGACRQCAVKQFKGEADTKGKIVMSCMTPVSEGARFSVEDPEAREFRKAVIEWLMVNHPHDCPVCDEGGECHLQDMTVMTGHAYRRYRFKKRVFRNQDMGPLVNHEMNRCIACYRCVRFYREYAGGKDLNVFAAHDHVYFGRQEDGVLESEFSGNLVEVCPTGVFTDKTLKKHYVRKWDLQTAPSVCVHCSLGCNTIPGARHGKLRRIRNRYHPEINGYFLCDRGRYGYEFTESERRLREPWANSRPVRRQEALTRIGGILSDPGRAARTIGIGSPRASLEGGFALRKLVGAERFFSGFSARDSRLMRKALAILRQGPVAAASLGDVERADAVLVLGGEVLDAAPRLALALRQSVRNQPLERARKLKIPDWQDAAVREAVGEEKGPLFIASSLPTRLGEELATETWIAAPDDLARLGFAIAHRLDPACPDALDLGGKESALADRIARALAEARRPLVVAGTVAGSEALLEAAANVAWAIARTRPARDEPGQKGGLCLVADEANSFGAGLLGGGDLDEAFERMERGEVDHVIVLENDLFRRAASGRVRSFLSKAKCVVLIDQIATAMLPRSHFILPAASFAEADATLINHEGRAQRSFRVQASQEGCHAGWRWISDLMAEVSRPGWESHEALLAEIEASDAVFQGIRKAAPPADFRIGGQKIPRQAHRFSGRTATYAEDRPASDPDSPFSFSMEGYDGVPPGSLIPRYWMPGWNSVQALNKFQVEVGGALRGGPVGQRLFISVAGSARLDIPSPRVEEAAYFTRIPPAFVRQKRKWLAVPIHHVFGSEELSALSPAIRALSPRPYVAISPGDARSLGIGEGDLVEITRGDGASAWEAPARIITSVAGSARLDTSVAGSARLDACIPSGVIGLPVGLPGSEAVEGLPDWVSLDKAALAGAA